MSIKVICCAVMLSALAGCASMAKVERSQLNHRGMQLQTGRPMPGPALHGSPLGNLGDVGAGAGCATCAK